MSTDREKIKVGFIVSPYVALMDLLGAHAVFGMAGDVDIFIIWKDKEVIQAAPTFPIAANTTFNDCPPLDVLVVGAMPPDVLADADLIQFVVEQAANDPYLIGICGGVLLYGSAGLINNKKATTNFHIIDALDHFGAEAIAGGKVVKDGKLFTAGPATGGFEAALMVLAELRGEDEAKLIELTIEYHPNPPFRVGTPELAGEALTNLSKSIYREFFSNCTASALNNRLTKQ